MAVAVVASVGLSGCGHYDYCPLDWSDTGPTTWFSVCQTRFEEEGMASGVFRLVQDQEGERIDWNRYYMHADDVRVSFNEIASNQSRPLHYLLLHKVLAKPAPGDFLSFCGPANATLLLGRDRWVGSVDGPQVDLPTCR